MDDIREKIASVLRIEDKNLLRELLAECIGTFFLVFIGNSANLQQSFGNGNSTSAHIAWGIGFAFAVYLAASVSGAHLNPAISVAQSILGNLPAYKIPFYMVAQVIGAYLGAAVAYFGHYDDIYLTNQNSAQYLFVAGHFTTFPTAKMSTWGSFLDQLIGTALLSGLVCLITDKRHKIPTGLVPVLAGSIMTMIAMTYGANGGFAINPARDLGPRLFCLCAGYGWQVFSAFGYYFWIPIVAPFIGAIIGAWIYKLFVGIHGMNEVLEVSSAPTKGYNDWRLNPQGLLIGYENTLSRATGQQIQNQFVNPVYRPEAYRPEGYRNDNHY